jgi:hypothetical protein
LGSFSDVPTWRRPKRKCGAMGVKVEKPKVALWHEATLRNRPRRLRPLLSVALGPNEYVNLSNIEDFALVFPLTAGALPRATPN